MCVWENTEELAVLANAENGEESAYSSLCRFVKVTDKGRFSSNEP
jgi:hypothetical protein